MNEIVNNSSFPEENLSPKKNQFFLYFLLLALLLLGLITVLVLNKNKKSNEAIQTAQNSQNFGRVSTPVSPTVPLDAQTVLSFSPAVINSPAGKEFTVYLHLNSGNNQLSALQFKLKYDPKIVQLVNIMPDKFFQNPIVLLKKIDQQEGQLSYAIGNGPSSQSGNNNLAVLTFKALSLGITGVNFVNPEAADINQNNNNVIKSSSGLTVTVSQ